MKNDGNDGGAVRSMLPGSVKLWSLRQRTIPYSPSKPTAIKCVIEWHIFSLGVKKEVSQEGIWHHLIEPTTTWQQWVQIFWFEEWSGSLGRAICSPGWHHTIIHTVSRRRCASDGTSSDEAQNCFIFLLFSWLHHTYGHVTLFRRAYGLIWGRAVNYDRLL